MIQIERGKGGTLKIYLAGKIHKNDWRQHLISPDLMLAVEKDSSAFNGPISAVYPLGSCHTGEEENVLPSFRRWPILSNALFGRHDYVGPYFISCDHGCYHSQNGHGVTCGVTEEEHGELRYLGKVSPTVRETILRLCLQAITAADIVFAWIDECTAYGTLAEIGYAVALRKIVWIASPKDFQDLWLTYTMAEETAAHCQKPYTAPCSHVIREATSPALALEQFFTDHDLDAQSLFCESPIEITFWHNARKFLPTLVPQYRVESYRIDFALPECKLGIEIDGHESHKSKEQRAHDAQKDRLLSLQGWTILRFTGSEVFRDTRACVEEVLRFAEKTSAPSFADRFLQAVQRTKISLFFPLKASTITRTEKKLTIDCPRSPYLAELCKQESRAIIEQVLFTLQGEPLEVVIRGGASTHDLS